jgi:hypothetical protein
MTKADAVANLNKIFSDVSSNDNGYEYKMNVNDWTNGNKSRTYFSIVETREGSKHYAKKDYGYFDNVSNEYVAGSSHLDGTLFTFSGAKF